MLQSIRKNYTHTIYAGYIGYITQAIVNNFAPLLFLTFARDYGLTLDKITLITTVNFFVQLLVDLVSAKVMDRIGYRRGVVGAHLFAALGLISMAFLPDVTGNAYLGLMTAVVLYAIGGGAVEVLISPIIESCPTEKKEAAMSLLHSFYCWGHVFVVLVSTAFFKVFGIGSWKILACIWAIIPICNLFYFCLVPLYPVTGEQEALSVGGLLRQKIFWLFLVIMVCAGASEQAMSQWASAFAESGLQVSKTVGDLAGPCAFALLMGSSRAIYARYSEKLPLKKYMKISAVLCVFCYVTAAFSGQAVLGLIGCALCGFAVGIFWPGTFSIAAGRLQGGGTAMYAFMALAGDVGCSGGPTLVGMVANLFDGNIRAGLTAAMIFPILILAGISLLREGKKE
ncbi:MFS transporter [Lachnospiraceae bacterium JLR.KK008]